MLVAVTDGNDTSSLVSLENVVKAAQQSAVVIYFIGLLSGQGHHEARDAKGTLEALAEATGGEAFFPKDVADAERTAHAVAPRRSGSVYD